MSDISYVRIKDETYDVKDALLRHQFNVLIGIEPPDNSEEQNNSKNNSEEE